VSSTASVLLFAFQQIFQTRNIVHDSRVSIPGIYLSFTCPLRLYLSAAGTVRLRAGIVPP
jgi:hypothetical protein